MDEMSTLRSLTSEHGSTDDFTESLGDSRCDSLEQLFSQATLPETFAIKTDREDLEHNLTDFKKVNF